MGYSPPHRSIREKYDPRMNAAEERHRERVMERLCFGCGGMGGVAHHTLLRFPEKRWRRDHRMLLPLCDPCHRDLHGHYGDEEKWLAAWNRTKAEAIHEMQTLWAESQMAEAK